MKKFRIARATLGLLFLAMLVPAITLAPVADAQSARKTPPLTIFAADSLTGYIATLAKAFKTAHPNVEVHSETSGSLDAIRKISDLHLPCDLMISADWRLLKEPNAGIDRWSVAFAGNSIGLLYRSQSRDADQINASNWWRILMQPQVRFGHSDPTRDPAGYWTLVVWQLAARYYNQPDLAARLAARCPRANIRPHNIYLIALLQSGELDYYFGYASDARLGKLKFLALPRQINLSDATLAREYAQASVQVGTGAHRTTITGAPIAYAATMTSAPPNRAAAIEFLKLMLSAQGHDAARAAGLIAYTPALASDPDHKMPRELQALTKPAPDD